MLKIINVEDDKVMADVFSAYIQAISKQNENDIEYVNFSGTDEGSFDNFVKYLEEDKVDNKIYIIDLLINGKNGIDFFNIIREKDKESQIIFNSGCSPNDSLYEQAQEVAKEDEKTDFVDKRDLDAINKIHQFVKSNLE